MQWLCGSARASVHTEIATLLCPLQAADDYSALLTMCAGQPSLQAVTIRLLLARAAVLEQLEKYGPALSDLNLAAALQLPAVNTQVGHRA